MIKKINRPAALVVYGNYNNFNNNNNQICIVKCGYNLRGAG